FTYDAAPHSVAVALDGPFGAPTGATTVKYNGSTTAPTNAGTYTVDVAFAGDAFYAATTATASLTINPATPTVSVDDTVVTYNAHAPSGHATVPGVSGESLGPATLTYSPANPVNAGSYDVTATFAASGNYTDASGAGTLTIEQAMPIVTVTDATVTYNG